MSLIGICNFASKKTRRCHVMLDSGCEWQCPNVQCPERDIIQILSLKTNNQMQSYSPLALSLSYQSSLLQKTSSVFTYIYTGDGDTDGETPATAQPLFCSTFPTLHIELFISSAIFRRLQLSVRVWNKNSCIYKSVISCEIF